MKFHILTLFPEMVEHGLNTSIIGRAKEQGSISIKTHDIRDYTTNKHKKVDDYPYGGGAGMLMQAQPVFDCFQEVKQELVSAEGKNPRVIYVTPQGKTFTQTMAEEFAREEALVFVCGHYEGIDERVLEEIVTDYVSIGDYVLTGGELPAMVMIDAVSRLVDGVLNNEESAQTESFHNCLLEYPQYSRPEEWHGKKVPQVLLSGNHKKIEEWRLAQSVSRTKERRPDLYEKYETIKCCEKYLLQNKLHHMDMIETLRRGNARILYFQKDGVLLQEKNSGIYTLTAVDRASGEKILSHVKGEIRTICSHQQFMNDYLCEEFGLEVEMECRQAVYTRKEALPVKTNGIIRKLDEGYTDVVAAHYYNSVEYVRGRLKSGAVYGIFEEDKLAGFAGIHNEGSMGMLEIFEEYRNRGYAKALESFLINEQLKKGWTPYGQVVTGNDKSFGLQNGLNLYLASEKMYWLGK